ncbi:hypothetical protein BYT27DRAFT_7228728 [Phlegmacium glaucopus]|nr:hypothetical protein BYT27DRAFT_7228728 [Phlegmacium glaucopus]
MPVPHSSKSRRSSPPSTIVTPARNGHKRTLSSNPGYSPTITSSGHQQKLNVVTRVAIEGKARRGQDGASIRMFLKITLPLDSVTPGSTIPLFSEENVKVLTSQVHPLDHNSVPFNFSSAVSPLLHNAARALNLPARSSENFSSAFGTAKSNATPLSNRSSKSSNTSGDAPLPIDVQYTGHILVSGYSISFVVPKVFLSPSRNEGTTDNEEGLSRTSFTTRRTSVGERSQAHFMAAIDLWVPFLCMPPRSPYLLSIPTPRCLHNHIKLRIFPPASTNTSASLASLSSMEDESSSWDLTSDPHVTRSVSSRPRANTYNSFADDESSEASTTGMSDSCAIQGTFPSAERIRVRWAKPMKTLNIPGIHADGRRRVGVEEVKGEMICTIRGKRTSASKPELEGVLMSVEYKGQCKGVWFPGVATLLGLDVSLEAKGSEISWAQGYSNQWAIQGGPGYTGCDNGSSDMYNRPNSRTSSFDSNGPQMGVPTSEQDSGPPQMRVSSTSSTSSLLRAPLPSQNIADLSFEGSSAIMPPTSLSPLGTMSSISSLPISSSSNPVQIRPPGSPITLHLNMNELQHPLNNIFTFTISGTVVVTARQTLARVNSLGSSHPFPVDKPLDLELITLPRYTVLAADSESTTITVRNEVDRASVEVFHPTGNIHTDAQARKTVLQTGGFTRCGEDGGRIALKIFEGFNVNGDIRERRLSRPRTPANNVATRGSSSAPISLFSIPSCAKRDGPPIISSVLANITALAHDGGIVPTDYAVRVCLKTPQLIGSEWLEFGMGYGSETAGTSQSYTAEKQYPKVHIICASLDGVPVQAEMTKPSTPDTAGSAAPFEELSKKAWISWGKVYVGTSAGGSIVIDYIVKERQTDPPDKGKKRASSDGMEMNIVLPTFFVSVARLEVVIDVMPGLEISSLRSNFHYHQPLPTGSRLLQYSLEEFSQPQLSLTICKTASRTGTPPSGVGWWFMLTWVLLSINFLWLYHIKLEMRQSAMTSSNYLSLRSTNIPFTMTTTFQENTATSRWFDDSCGETVMVEMSSISSPNASPTPTDDPPISEVTKPLPEWTPLRSQLRHTTEDTLIHTTSVSILENYGLIRLRDLFASSWSEQHKNVLMQVLEKVIDTMEVVWKIFEKVYHYPLDPP